MWWLLLNLCFAAPPRDTQWAQLEGGAWRATLFERGPDAAFAQAQVEVAESVGWDRALLLGELGGLQATAGALLEARQTLGQALALAQEHGGTDQELAYLHLRLGTLLLQLEDPGYRVELDLAEQGLLDQDSPKALDLRYLVATYQTVGGIQWDDYERAATWHQRMGKLLEQGQDTPMNRAQWLLQKAQIAHGRGDYLGGRQAIDEAIGFLETAEVDPLMLAVAHHQAAYQCEERGEYEAGLAYLRDSVRVRERAQGRDHPQTLQALFDLGLLTLQATEDEVTSRAMMKDAMRRMRRQLGPTHPLVLDMQVNVGLLELKVNDAAMALSLLTEARDALVQRYGEDDAQLDRVERSLAKTEQRLGHPVEAGKWAERVIARIEARAGVGHPDLIDLYQLRGELEPDPALGTVVLQQAHQLLADTLGSDHPAVGQFAIPVAELALRAGKLELAGQLCEQAQRAPKNQPAMAVRLAMLEGDLAHRTGQPEVARDAWLRAHAIAEEVVSPRMVLGSDRDRMLAYSGLAVLLARLLAQPEHVEENWRKALAFKGGADRALAHRRQLIARAADDPELDALVSHWRRATSELSGQAWSMEDAERPAPLRSLFEQVEELERLLVARFPASRVMGSDDVPRIDALCRSLPEGALLVDVIDAATQHHQDLQAFVLLGGACDEGAAQLSLGPVPVIDEAATAWQQALSTPAAFTTQVDGRGQRLAGIVLPPLSPWLSRAEELWVVGDGALATVPWGALPTDGGYLLEALPIRYFDSALDVLDRATEPPVVRDALLVAEPDFGGDATSTGQRSAAACVERNFAPLPYTAGEANRVGQLLEKHAHAEVELLAGSSADEATLAAGLADRQLVHLATHGFFAGSNCTSALDADAALREVAGYSPLVLSGLALAGANEPFDPLAPNDGLWTAEEIAALSLDQAELVVLSACQTGLGVATRSGVMVQGLRRAFAVAGAERVLMTLWSVGDADASRLMTAFYERWLDKRGGDVALALREAKLAELARNRQRYGEARPNRWAGWIATE